MAFQPGQTLYVNQIPTSGWLNVRDERGRTLLPVLEFTQVRIKELKAGRTYFEILDSGRAGVYASLGDANARQYLGGRAPVRTNALVQVRVGTVIKMFSEVRNQSLIQNSAELVIGPIRAKATLNTELGEYTAQNHLFPLPIGTYNILIPTYPHDKGATAFYRTETPSLAYDQVWFPIEYGDNSRFIHAGQLSHGCVSVMEMIQWNAVYKELIKHRPSGDKYIGKLVVAK